MADIKFIPKARNANAIPEEPFSNGSLIAATDTGELYVDYNGARMRIGDVITLETEAQRLATLAPLPKLYWVAETGKLWRFADDWVCVNPDAIEADTLSIGKSTFFNVASYTHNGNVYELLLKTAIYKGSGAANVLIRVHGHCGDSIVDFTVHLYWYNNSYTYRAAVNNGSIQPTLKAFSYTADKEYVGLAIIGLMYYPRLTVDMFDMWSINRRYGKNWTIEANTTSSATSIVPEDDLTDITWQPICSDIEANTIEANMIKADIVQADRWYYGVAKVSSAIPVYEIIVKTRIPVINQSAVNTIHLYGSDSQSVVDTTLVLYWQNTTAKFPWRHIINAGVRRIKAKVFTYEDNGTEYVGFALLPQGGSVIYFGYPRFSIDFCDIMSNVRDYSKDWTVELNTVKDSTSIIPQTNLMDCIESKINSDISGSATYLATPRTIALTGGVTGTATAFDGSKNIQIPVTSVNPNNLSNAVPVTKGGTGATSAANARTALEAGYTIRRTITTTGAGWYRIAATTASVGRNYTDVYIDASLAGRNSQIGLIAAVTYGSSTTAPTAIQLTQKACVEQYKDGVTKARIVYVNGGYSGKYAYLEIYQAYDAAATYSIEFQNCRGWATRYDEPIAGEIPDGYSARELTFVHNAVVADNFVGDLTGTSTNSEQLAGVNADQYALKDYANQTFLPLAGGTLTGSLTANSFRGIVNPPRNKGSYFLNEPNTSAAAYIPELMADRLQFFPPANCLLETSSDGTSWTTRSTPNAQKQQLLCCHPSYTAEIDWAAGTQLRITFTADSYVFLSLLYLYLRTSGKIDVVIEQFRNASQDWVEVARQEQVTGQSIHVVLWHTVIRFQNSTNDMHSGKVRVTLIHTGTDTPILDQLRWKGGYPTANPYIYDWDPSRNVMFPAEVRASNFNGSWNDKAVAPSFNENSTSTIPTCKQIADYVKSLIGG